MGLDTIELVMAVEERFDIAIADVDAERLATVGDLCDYVFSKTQDSSTRKCRTAQAFYFVRRAFMDCCGVSRGEVRPGREVAELVSGSDLRVSWHRLRRTLGGSAPHLEWPTWWVASAGGVLLSVISMSIATLWNPGFSVHGPIVFLLTVICVLSAAGSLRTRLPAITVGDMARRLADSYWVPAERHTAERRQMIFEDVRHIVGEFTAIDPETIERETHFVEDLNF